MPSDDLKARALRYLAQREHSRSELEKKLAAYGEADAIKQVLDRMDALGLQSDARFAESFVRSRGERLGRKRLEHELAQRGIAPDAAQAACAAELGADELMRARAVWVKKFATPPEDAKEWARQARFLSARGFAAEVVRQVLKEPFDESA
jgi:regulatory protein